MAPNFLTGEGIRGEAPLQRKLGAFAARRRSNGSWGIRGEAPLQRKPDALERAKLLARFGGVGIRWSGASPRMAPHYFNNPNKYCPYLLLASGAASF
jgi:hypothetical protein